MFAIYQLKNLVNGDRYIGFTTHINPELRFEEHKSNVRQGIKFHLYSAMRKYGVDNFQFQILEIGENEEYGRKIAEPMYIAWLQPKYNMTRGGDGVVGYVFTEEAKRKISESIKGKKHSEERKLANRNAKLGRKLSSTHKDAIRKGLEGKKKSVVHIKRISDSLCGRRLSDDHKRSISEGQKKRWTHRLSSKSSDFQSEEPSANLGGSTNRTPL
jgi:group I intron endonuclease